MKSKKLFTTRFLLPIGVLLLFSFMAIALRGVLVALAIAFVAAYLLNPSVTYLQALRIPRIVGAALVIWSVIGCALFVVFIGVPGAAQELVEASSRFPAMVESLRQNASTWVSERLHLRIPPGFGDLATKFSNELRSLAPNPADVAGAFAKAMDAIVAALGSLIVPIFTYYFLVDFTSIVRYLRKLVPRSHSAPVEGLAREIDGVISRYVRGQAWKSFILAFLYALALRIVGVRLALPIGILTGVLTFIPYAGVAIGMSLAIFMTLLDWHSASQLWAIIGVMSLIVIIDHQLITPRVVGESAPLKTMEVLLAMIGAVSLFGVVGLLFSVPLGALVKILLRRIANAYLDSNFYQGISEPTAAEAAENESAQLAIAPVPAPAEPSVLRNVLERFSLPFGARK